MTATDQSMKDKVCLVTGGTGGIGWAIARGLAAKGATPVIAGKNASKGAAAAERISRETGKEYVEFVQVDLSSQEDIRRFAEEFKSKYDRLDVLVNNAGGFFWHREESVDGLEMTFALNHLGYFLVTNLLLDLVKTSAPSRIVITASGSHESQKLNFNDLQLTRKYSSMAAYGKSKLANLLFTYELARRLEGTGVTVNAFTPGLTATDIGKQSGGIAAFGKSVVDRLMGQASEQGAQTGIYLATSPEVDGVSGKYFAKLEPIESSEYSHNPNVARRLWAVSEQLTGLNPQKG